MLSEKQRKHLADLYPSSKELFEAIEEMIEMLSVLTQELNLRTSTNKTYYIPKDYR